MTLALLHIILLIIGNLSVIFGCQLITSRPTAHQTQLSAPMLPPPSPTTCGHSVYYNHGEMFTPIVGGVQARPNEFPWQVRLRVISGTETYLCGATIINAWWVITAAHCAKAAVGAGSIIAVLGDFDRTVLEQGEVSIPIARAVFHPEFNNITNEFDVCMLQLQSSIPYTGAVQPICLPESCSQSACQVGATGWITGWGTQSSHPTSPGSNTLLKAWVPIVSSYKCQRTYSYVLQPITDRMLCAGFADGGVDTCRGDSGGPLICNGNGYFELGGITSFGQGCGESGYYGVYTRICAITDWIKSTASQMI